MACLEPCWNDESVVSKIHSKLNETESGVLSQKRTQPVPRGDVTVDEGLVYISRRTEAKSPAPMHNVAASILVTQALETLALRQRQEGCWGLLAAGLALGSARDPASRE